MLEQILLKINSVENMLEQIRLKNKFRWKYARTNSVENMLEQILLKNKFRWKYARTNFVKK